MKESSPTSTNEKKKGFSYQLRALCVFFFLRSNAFELWHLTRYRCGPDHTTLQ